MTEVELLTAILNRLDLIYTLLLITFVVAVVILVFYILYRAVVNFM